MTDQPEAGRRRSAAGDGPRPGDAFGATLMACWEAGTPPCAVFELVERDDGFLDAHDAARYFAGPEQWDPLDHWLCRPARGRILDVGCGAGRAALHRLAPCRAAARRGAVPRRPRRGPGRGAAATRARRQGRPVEPALGR